MTRCTYEEFGREFFEYAVSRERVLESVREMAAEPIEVGPMSVGPGGVARVTVRGEAGDPTAERLDGDLIRYRVRLPVRLDIAVDRRVDEQRFEADLVVPRGSSAYATDDLRVEVVVDPPRPSDIEVDLQAAGLRAELLQKVAGMEDEIREVVAQQIKDDVAAGAEERVIDVRESIDDE